MSEAPRNDVSRRFIARVRLLREQRKISARELSSLAGLPLHTLANMEAPARAGERYVTVDKAVMIARALGVRAGDLLDSLDGPCQHCGGKPPEGFTCQTCGALHAPQEGS